MPGDIVKLSPLAMMGAVVGMLSISVDPPTLYTGVSRSSKTPIRAKAWRKRKARMRTESASRARNRRA